ncbi:ComEC/Rec2 family competence protein [Candidatus Gracilibacteria bacterium]|nr:ComEC/Rec2 family competence protein [Candidatus Gracilibacteria bacterium]
MVFAVIGIIIGIFISQVSTSEYLEKDLKIIPYSQIKSEITFEIKDIYKILNYTGEYIVELNSINGKTLNDIYGIVSIPSNFTVEKGDIINVRETLLPVENFNESFNYKKFMFSKNIFFKIKAGSINRIDFNKPHILFEKISLIREELLQRIYSLYPEEEAIFLGGILLGARESLPQDLKDNFNASGLTHFIAVSGFNITILIVFFSFILKIFPIFIRVSAITIFIILFTLLVGDAAPVIRASIMGLLAYYIMVSGRNTHNLALLLFTACIMVGFSPLILNYDVSFHLSFLAVIGIIYTQSFWKKIFYFLPETLAIKEAFVLTLSALVFALPVMIFNFGQLSILAPFANIAVTWTIPLAMLFGFISIFLTDTIPFLGEAITYITWVLLAWDIKVVHFFGGLDWAIIRYDFGIWKYSLQILYFIMIVFIINIFSRDNN